MPSAVQRVFETCKDVFADGGPGIVPSPDEVERLRSVLDAVMPADVGLSPSLSFFRDVGTGGPPPVTYLHLYECPKFSIGIFCLPQGAVIPLHDHPAMTVFSKLLMGSMRIKSYDWVNDPRGSGSNQRIKSSTGASLAKLHTDAISVAPCETSVLYPAAGGNLHCFTAVTSCAVLDVLGPPYDDEEGRACTYYRGNADSDLPGMYAVRRSPYITYDDPSAAWCKLYAVVGSDRRCVFGFSFPRRKCFVWYAWLLVSGDGLTRCGEREEYYAWLEERGSEPDELVVRGAEYKGPRIVDH